MDEIIEHHENEDQETVEAFLQEFNKASINGKRRMLQELKQRKADADLTKKERKTLKKVYREELVKRFCFAKNSSRMGHHRTRFRHTGSHHIFHNSGYDVALGE